MPATVHIPIRIRTDPAAPATRGEEVASAVAAAAGRALRNARLVVGRQWRGPSVPLPPAFTWTGVGADAVPQAVRNEFEDLIRDAIAAAVAAELTTSSETTARPTTSGPLPPNPREPFDPTRFDPERETYTIPSYQEAGKEFESPLKSGSKQVREKFIKAQLKRLAAGDKDDIYFIQLVKGEAPDAAALLKELADRNPVLFRKLIREEILKQSASLFDVERVEGGFTLRSRGAGNQQQQIDDALDMIAKLRELAGSHPAGAHLADEWEVMARGAKRLLALIDVVIAARADLLAELTEETEDPLDEAVVGILKTRLIELRRVAALVVAVARTKKAAELFPPLERDLIENVRWLAAVREKTRAVGGLLALYRLVFGHPPKRPPAPGTPDLAAVMKDILATPAQKREDELEEVAALLDARDLLVNPMADSLLPSAERIATVLRAALAAFNGWRGRAGAKKRLRIRKVLGEIKKVAGWDNGQRYYKNIPSSSYYGFLRAVDQEYNPEVDLVVRGIGDLERDLTAAESAAEDDDLLTSTINLDSRAGRLLLQTQLLILWYGCIAITDQVVHHKIGFEAERKGITIPTRYGWPQRFPGWIEQLDKIRREVVAFYRSPQPGPDPIKPWFDSLTRIQGEISKAADRDFWIAVGITVIATVATFGVGSVVTAAGGGTILVLLAEAATFTIVSNAGQALLLGKPIDPADLIGEFVENAVLFGALKGLNLAAVSIARAVFAGRTLVQLGAVIGTQLFVGTAMPLIFAELDRVERGQKELPEQTKKFLIANFVINVFLIALTGKQLRDSLSALNLADAARAARTAALTAARQAFFDQAKALFDLAKGFDQELFRILTNPNLTEAEFEAFKAKAAKVYPELERLANTLSKAEWVTDAEFARFGMSRQQLADLAQKIADFNQIIQSTPYKPPPKALPAPSSVPGVVPTADGSFEYNPNQVGQRPADLTVRFKGAGYGVTDLGGGVLQLTAPGGGRPVLLLPAPEPGRPVTAASPVERALGWRPPAEATARAAELKAINPELVNPNLLARLGTSGGVAASDEAMLSALSLIGENRNKLTGFWKLDAVRGLVAAQELRQAIPRSVVNRLFKTLTEAQLRGLFEKFHLILENKGVAGGARHLIQGRATPEQSLAMVEAYDAIRLAGLEMPELTAEAASGLVPPSKPSVTDLVADIKGVPKADRVKWLEGRKPLKRPQPPPTPLAEAVTLEYAQKSASLVPGIDLLADTPDAVSTAIEKSVAAAGGKFSTPEVRERFVDMIAKYRSELYAVRDGVKTERNNLNSALDEIALALAEMRQGAATVVFSENRKKFILDVPTAQFTGPNGFKLTNAPATIQLLFDGVFLTATGDFKVVETTVGGPLSLPTEFAGLDPQGPSPGAPADFSKLDGQAENVKKVLQLLKYRAAADTAAAIGAGFRTLRGAGGTAAGGVPKVTLEIHARGFTKPFQRAAEFLGFKCVVVP
jgi:hypothetical protein